MIKFHQRIGSMLVQEISIPLQHLFMIKLNYLEKGKPIAWFRSKMAGDSISYVINAAMNIPLSLLAVAGNSLILVSFVKNPSLISPSNIILISLALSDLCVGLVVQPMYIAWRLNQFDSINETRRQDILFLVTVFLSAILCMFSLLTVTVLSADRYLALRLHLRYNEFITERRMYCFLGLLSVGSVAICSVTLFFQAYDEFLGSFTAIACFVVNAVLYLKIYRVVQRHKRQINGLQSGRRLVNILRFRTSSLAMFYVYLIFLLCYLPYTSLAILYPLFRSNTSVKIAFEASWTLVYMNSALNPMLYSWRLKRIRMAVTDILCRLCRKKLLPRTEETNRGASQAIPS